MRRLKVGIVMRISGLAVWGSPFKDLTTGPPISTCYHVGMSQSLICIRGQYLKGLIRRWAELIEPILLRNGFISKELTRKIFGEPPPPQGGKASSIPSPIRVGDAYPVRDCRAAEELFKEGSFTYLTDSSGKICNAETALVTRVRIDDLTETVAEGSLFHETVVAPDTLMYFELSVGGLKIGEDVESARLLLASIAQLGLSFAGRSGSSLSIDKVLIEPEQLLSDNVVKLIAGWFR